MANFDKAMSRLKALQRKFEGLLEAARNNTARVRAAPSVRAIPLREQSAFGANPGNLRMFLYVPERLPSAAPLVVALHGCSQSADEYDHGTGWSSLANRLGFAVLYPQQQPANNPKNCFSWFLSGDIARGRGEALSIRQMVEHAVGILGIDRHRVFVTGLSAGGAMAAVMLATYPEVFAGGAIIAGLPYGCARSVQQAFDAMFSGQSHGAAMLGERVRAATRHRGPWPKISIWHGTADPIVKPSNAEDLIRQWTNVHGLAAVPSHEELVGGHARRVWNDASGEPLVEAFSISGMAHGVPLAINGEDCCGAAGVFFLDAGISSPHHIAKFWRLGDGRMDRARAPAMVLQPQQIASENRALVVAAPPAADWRDLAAASFAESVEPDDGGREFDANIVIASAFKAAGLPVPEMPKTSPGATPHVAPGPIIAAALKAAGLTRR